MAGAEVVSGCDGVGDGRTDIRLRRDRRTHSAASRSPPKGSARRESKAGRREGSIGSGAGVGTGRVRITWRAGMGVVRGVEETMSSKGEDRLRGASVGYRRGERCQMHGVEERMPRNSKTSHVLIASAAAP